MVAGTTNSGDTLTMSAMNEPRSVTHAAVRDALLRVQQREVVRYRHGRVLDALHALSLIEWIRQPVRISQQLASPESAFYRAPVKVAQLTVAGLAALDRLVRLAAAPGWPQLADEPYS